MSHDRSDANRKESFSNSGSLIASAHKMNCIIMRLKVSPHQFILFVIPIVYRLEKP